MRKRKRRKEKKEREGREEPPEGDRIRRPLAAILMGCFRHMARLERVRTWRGENGRKMMSGR